MGGSELVPRGGMNSDHANFKFTTAWEGSVLVPGAGMNSDHPQQRFVKMLGGVGAGPRGWDELRPRKTPCILERSELVTGGGMNSDHA